MRAVGWPLAAALIAICSLALTLALCRAAVTGDQQNGDQP